MGSLFSKKSAPPKADLTKADYREAVKERTAASRQASLNLLDQLQKESQGQGASLADLQTRAASNKNLADLLAASAVSRSPVAKASTLTAGKNLGQALAAQAGSQRAQEITQKQNLLGSLGVGQQQQDLAQVMEPGKLLANAEMQRYEADLARRRAVKDQQSAVLGAVLMGGAQFTGGLSSMGGSSANPASSNPASSITSSRNDLRGQRLEPYRPYAFGGEVPGEPTTEEDDLLDDTEPALLSPKEIVLPKSVTLDEDAPEKAKEFVENIKKDKPKKDQPAFLKALKIAQEQLTPPAGPSSKPITFQELLAARQVLRTPAISTPTTVQPVAPQDQRMQDIKAYLASLKGDV